MIEHVLSGIGGVGFYGVLSVCLFFAVFLGVLVWACRLNPSHLQAMSRLPLDGTESVTEGASEELSNSNSAHE